MYGKPAMTYFKYQVLYLYGSDANTYLNGILWVVTEPSLWVIRLPLPPTTGSPLPLCTVWQNNLHPFGIELQYD
jgi:hypothetical protein